MYAAILAGGVGTRLWPCSRQAQPKQFSDITGSGLTMIQEVARRLDGLIASEDVYVITGRPYTQLVSFQLPHVLPHNIIAEPSGRNTAPAVGLACAHLARRDPQAILAVLPADHMIQDAAALRAALRQAEIAAQAGYLVTLGVEPAYPHTGYGYLKRAHRLELQGQLKVYAVDRFLEKPDLATASAFLKDGTYYWNAGIFVARVDRLLAEMDAQLPELSAALHRIQAAIDTPQAEPVLLETWDSLPSISVDFGLMEHAQQVAMVPLQAGWNDVGSWDALVHVLQPDTHGNYQTQPGALLMDSHNNIIYNGTRQMVLLGIEDIVVVDTGDVLLVGHREQMQRVKEVVDELRARGQDHLL